MSTNVVILDGTVNSLALRYDSQARPELRWTLVATDQGPDGQPWTSYWPCCASGSTALRLAETLEDGQYIVSSSGRLCYRKRQTRTGEQSRVEVLTWTADVLSESPQAERSDEGEQENQGGEPANAPGGERPLPQKRTRGYIGVRSGLQEA